MKKAPSESQEQQRLVLKLRWFHPNLVLFSIPNGGKRNRGEARKLVLEGVEPGIPDLFIAEPNDEYHGLFVEMKKVEKSKTNTSKEQLEKHKLLKSKGYCVAVCFGSEEAYDVILRYIGER